MRYPRLHRPRRNAADPPTVTVTSQGDFIRMRIAQLRQFASLRGADKTTEPLEAHEPYASGFPAHQLVPRTTNADVRALVAAWDQAFRAYRLRDQRLGGSHNEAFEKTHRARWKRTRTRVARLAQGKPPAAPFAENARFWGIWLADVARYLSERQLGRPARLEVVAEVLEQSVAELPETLAHVAEAASDAAADAARRAGRGIGRVGTWLEWGALAGVGVLIVPRLVRALPRASTP